MVKRKQRNICDFKPWGHGEQGGCARNQGLHIQGRRGEEGADELFAAHGGAVEGEEDGGGDAEEVDDEFPAVHGGVMEGEEVGGGDVVAGDDELLEAGGGAGKEEQEEEEDDGGDVEEGEDELRVLDGEDAGEEGDDRLWAVHCGCVRDVQVCPCREASAWAANGGAGGGGAGGTGYSVTQGKGKTEYGEDEEVLGGREA
ncbi:hypothetical protein L7F22_056607 [Adiantum nelumboides]|nr:hypothetical protein [Adiantum nelumboides]